MWRDRQDGGFQMREGLRNSGNLQAVEVVAPGLWGWEQRLVALLRTVDRTDVIAARPQDSLRGGEWTDGMPANINTIAGVAHDPDWLDTRHRLIAVSATGIWVWKCR